MNSIRTFKNLHWGIVTLSMILLSFALSCEKGEPDKPNGSSTGQDSTKYNISVLSESDLYEVAIPSSAAAGENVEITITLKVEGVNILSVLYNDTATTFDSLEQSTATYHFTMPEEDVEIVIENSCDIFFQESEYYTVSCNKESASHNEEVNFSFTVTQLNYTITRATFNQQECTFVGEQDGEYQFTFAMPDCPVTIVGYGNETQPIIERSWDENCVIVMLDCINNQGTDEEYCSQTPGELVHFIEKHDLGYLVEITLTGLETGTDYTSTIYWSLAADNHLYQDSWAFIMPDESVLINATSTQKDDYASEEFIGKYSGSLIKVGPDNIYMSNEHLMEYNLYASTAYSLTSTDEKMFDSEGLYVYSDNRIEYIAESCTNDVGANATIVGNDFILVEIHDLIYDSYDHITYYFASKSQFDFVCASDSQYGIYYLLEANTEDSQYHYYFDIQRKKLHPAEVIFTQGSSIAEESIAKVFVDSEPLCIYEYTPQTTPIFTYKGNEAGTYSSNEYGTLVLDGFGSGEYNGNSGTYTLSGTIVTFEDGTQSLNFNIDMNNMTFKLIENINEWGYYSEYTLSGAQISISGQTSTNGTVTIRIDQNLLGDEKEGYAAIQIQYPGAFGRLSDMISDCQPYYYDSQTSTLTITNVLQGTGTSWSTERKDITLKVSNDLRTMTFEADYIFSTSSPQEYIFGGETNTLTAVE